MFWQFLILFIPTVDMYYSHSVREKYLPSGYAYFLIGELILISGSYDSVGTLQTETIEITDHPYYFCPNNCGRKYKYKYNLNQHLKHGCGVPKKFVCEVCNKAFAIKSSLKSHMGLRHKIIM